ncbi:MAG TPA: glycosyltransferase family 2 protein [Thermoanaerobaculia bacterium]|nr:glycosyltransferase family 2 protein [Thermoanaerobaculia bacterium]HUM29732.1 glycosyltransferase family 2 protein [Thermoanaerobaculia bacterium]HXK67032.1 glycosyltransferase family 2 protein [Thermoanaerobaculia bacterium]
MVIHVIIPAYNEAGRIEGTLDALYEYSRTGPHRLAVSVVDDGSTDPTVSIVTAYRDNVWSEVRLVRLPRNLGKGAAVRYGMMHLAPGCDWALLSDADLSTPIEEVETLLAHSREAGILIGSRALNPDLITIHQPALRQLMGKVFNLLIRTLFLDGFYDTQCGFKLFRPHIARQIFTELTTPGFAFDVEVIARAYRRGYVVKEVPVRWEHRELSRVSIVGAPLKMLKEIVKLRLRMGRVRPAFPPAWRDGRRKIL